MKRFALLALPLLAAACDRVVTEAPEPPALAAADVKPAVKPPAPKPAAIREAQLEGAWSNPGGNTAAFQTADGGKLIEITCHSYGADAGGNMLEVWMQVPAGSPATSIDIFTGSGAVAVPVTVDAATGVATGSIPPFAAGVGALTVGQGDMRILADTQAYALENSTALESVVEACRPIPAATPKTPDEESGDTPEETPPKS